MGFIRRALATLGLAGVLYSNLYSQDYPKGLPDRLSPTKSVSEESQDKNKNGFRDEFELKIPYKIDGKEVIFNAYLVKEQTFEKPAVGWYIDGGEIKDIFMYSDLCRLASINFYVRDIKKQGIIKLLEEKEEIYRKVSKILEAKKGLENISQVLGKYAFAEFGIPPIPSSISDFGLDALEEILKPRFAPSTEGVAIGSKDLLKSKLKKEYEACSEEDVLECLLDGFFISASPFNSGISSLEYLINVVDDYGEFKDTSFLDLKDCFLFDHGITGMVIADAYLAYVGEILSAEAGTFKTALKNVVKEAVKGGSGIDADRLTAIVGLDGKHQRGIKKGVKVLTDWEKSLWQMDTTYELRTKSNAIRIAKIMGIKRLSAEETLKEFIARGQNDPLVALTMMNSFSRFNVYYAPYDSLKYPNSLAKYRFDPKNFHYDSLYSLKKIDSLGVENFGKGLSLHSFKIRATSGRDNPKDEEFWLDIFLGKSKEDKLYRVLDLGSAKGRGKESELKNEADYIKKRLEAEEKVYK